MKTTKRVKMTDDPIITKNTLGLSKKEQKRFEEKLIQKTETIGDCILWTGKSTNNKGHGRIRVNGILVYVHRLMYMIKKGAIPKGMNIHHICHNPNCINPDHLMCISHNDHVKLHFNTLVTEEK